MTATDTWWSLIDTVGPAQLDQRVREGVLSPAAIRQLLEPIVAKRSVTQQAAMVSLALLWHDHLDAAHKLCQDHEGDQDCDYVHALMHRREPDYSNSKYWFRAVGRHPAYAILAQDPVVLRADDALIVAGAWQPHALVDACETAIGTGQEQALREVQAHEFAVFANYLAGL